MTVYMLFYYFFNPSTQFVLCGSYDSVVDVWDAKTNGLEKLMKEYNHLIISDILEFYLHWKHITSIRLQVEMLAVGQF